MGAKYITMFIAVFIACAYAFAGSYVGSSMIAAPAVIIGNNTGSITHISLNITTGNGTVSITGPSAVGTSTLQSAQQAAQYAANYTGKNFSNFDFKYHISDANANVSGPSAGAAMTILAISAFKGEQIHPNITMTGTIGANGNIGEIGGVIDKAQAASKDHLDAIFVPAAQFDPIEEEMYAYAQMAYNIPLIQVANITQAASYIFNGSTNFAKNELKYNYTVDYNLSNIQTPNANCIGICDELPFQGLASYTINTTSAQISNLSSNTSLSPIAAKLSVVLNDSASLYDRGYFYTAADLAFLDYVNAHAFASYKSNPQIASETLDNVSAYCSSLISPALTYENYQYVIAAQMRQGWGNYTINQTISEYNASQVTSDSIFGALSNAGEAGAWCDAASYLYSYNYQNASYVIPSSALRTVAMDRISRARQYPSMYLTLAQAAYKSSNYPVAIYDADYAFALGNSSTAYSGNTTMLNKVTSAMLRQANYGVWATEFSKEASFYLTQSEVANNKTEALGFAQQAYSAAYLAQVLSADTQIISTNLMQVSQPVQQGQGEITYLQQIQAEIEGMNSFLQVIIVLIMLVIIMLFFLLVMVGMTITHQISAKFDRLEDKKQAAALEKKNPRNINTKAKR